MSLLDYARATERLAKQLPNHYVYLQVSAAGIVFFTERWEDSEEVADEYAAFKKSLKAFACLLREAVSRELAASRKVDPADAHDDPMPEEADEALNDVGAALGDIHAFFEELEELAEDSDSEEKPSLFARLFKKRNDDDEDEHPFDDQEKQPGLFTRLFTRHSDDDRQSWESEKRNIFSRWFTRRDRDDFASYASFQAASTGGGSRINLNLKNPFSGLFTRGGSNDWDAPQRKNPFSRLFNRGETNDWGAEKKNPLARLFTRKDKDDAWQAGPRDEEWDSDLKPSLIKRILFPRSDENKEAFEELKVEFDRAVNEFRVYMDLRHGHVLRKMSKRAKKMSEDVTEVLRRLDEMVKTHSPEEQQKYMQEIDLRLMHRAAQSPNMNDSSLFSTRIGAFVDLLERSVETRLRQTLEPYMMQQQQMLQLTTRNQHPAGNELSVALAEMAEIKHAVRILIQHIAAIQERNHMDSVPMHRLVENIAAKVDSLLLTNDESQRQMQLALHDLSRQIHHGAPRAPPALAYPRVPPAQIANNSVRNSPYRPHREPLRQAYSADQHYYGTRSLV